MTTEVKLKKRVVISYQNLSAELQEELKKKYPLGYTDSMLRVDKKPGDFFYAVVLETEDVSYLVKVDVKVDGNADEEDDKDDDDDYYDDDIKGADDIADDDNDSE